MGNETILIMCDSLQRYKFMRRFALALKEYKIIFITGEPIVCFYAKLDGIKVLFLRCKSIEVNNTLYLESIANQSIEVLNGECTVNAAIYDIASSLDILIQNIDVKNVIQIIIWNGQQLLGRILTEFAVSNNLSKIYFEISNLPHKLFVDPHGVNALSSIALDNKLISNLAKVENDFHDKWILNYMHEKKKPLPQSVHSRSRTIVSFLNRCTKFIFKGVGLRTINVTEIIFSAKGVAFVTDNFDLIKNFNNYIFLPLQVSADTQLKLHSKVNNIDAIKVAYKRAMEKGLELVVKIHPAEKSQHEIDKIFFLKQELNFKVTNTDTNSLIANSALVITINSTVGLEAMLQKKQVEVLGNALYKNFDQEDLKKYIHRYLIDGLDYFSDEKLSSHSVKKALKI